MSNEANRPVEKFRVGSITASIWRNSGDKGTFYNTTFENRYQDKDGNWKKTESHSPADLLALAKAADLAHTMILNLMSHDKKGEDAAA